MAYVDLGCRFALGIVFVVSAWSKLRSPAAFAVFTRSVRRLGVLPTAAMARLAAMAVAAAEVAVPILVVIPWDVSVVAGYAVAAAMLSAFTVGIALSLRRGDRTPCSCFGRSAVPLGGRHVIRNLLLVAITVGGAAAVLAGSDTEDVKVAIVAAVAGLVTGALVTVADDLAELVSPSTRHRP